MHAQLTFMRPYLDDCLWKYPACAAQVNLVREYLDLVVQYPPRCDKVVKKHVMALMFGGFIHNKKMIQEVFKPRDVKGIRAAVESVLKCVLEAEAAKQQKAATPAAPALDPIDFADDLSTVCNECRLLR